MIEQGSQRKGFWREFKEEATKVSEQTRATTWFSKVYTLVLMFSVIPWFAWASYRAIGRFHPSVVLLDFALVWLALLVGINTKFMIESLRKHGIRNNGMGFIIYMGAGWAAIKNVSPDPPGTGLPNYVGSILIFLFPTLLVWANCVRYRRPIVDPVTD